MSSPQLQAKKAAESLVVVARQAGWTRAKFEMRPDGSLIGDVSMIEADGADEFMAQELRMGK